MICKDIKLTLKTGITLICLSLSSNILSQPSEATSQNHSNAKLLLLLNASKIKPQLWLERKRKAIKEQKSALLAAQTKKALLKKQKNDKV